MNQQRRKELEALASILRGVEMRIGTLRDEETREQNNIPEAFRCTDQYESMTYNIVDMGNAIEECGKSAHYLKQVIERRPKPMEL